MTMKEIEVKSLEWSEVIGRDDQYYKGISAPGYRIDWKGYGKGEGPYKLDKHGEFETLEAAKAAAQADFDARIRSALVERKAEPVALSADEIKFLIQLLKAKISEDQSKHSNGKLWGHEIVNMSAMQRLVARLSASPSPVDSREEVFDQIVAARKAHIDAVAAYNGRLEFVRAERERGNWLNVDPEYAAMSEAQSAFYRTVQELSDAALAEEPSA